MNTDSKTSGNETRTDPKVTSIRGDAASKDASSGKAMASHEPQQGSAIDNGARKGPGTNATGDRKH